MSQNLRNKLYGLAVTLLPAAVILGWISGDQSDQALVLVDNGLGIAAAAIAWVTNVIAFAKSLPSRVTTINVPQDDVAQVVTRSGGTVRL